MVTDSVFDRLHAKFMRWLIRRDHAGKRLGIFREFLPRTMDGMLQMEMDFNNPTSFQQKRARSDMIRDKPRDSNRKAIYGKTSSDLVRQYLKDPESLTPKELQFLGKEATYHDRRLLELELDPNHPLLREINEHYRIKTGNGFELML